MEQRLAQRAERTQTAHRRARRVGIFRCARRLAKKISTAPRARAALLPPVGYAQSRAKWTQIAAPSVVCLAAETRIAKACLMERSWCASKTDGWLSSDELRLSKPNV